jgi:pSer/pThr/pTyr-binding forkhead associated (FHA) protein
MAYPDYDEAMLNSQEQGEGTAVLPDDPHTSTPQDLSDRMAAERAGVPFLVYRDSAQKQVIVTLEPEGRVTIGRRESNAVALPWDHLVSRFHTTLEDIGGGWTIADDGMSQNGTYLNGARVHARVRLADRDVIRVGETLIRFRTMTVASGSETAIDGGVLSLDELSASQRRVLSALVRPLASGDGLRVPADNQQIADDLVMSVETVKSALKQLFAKFDLADAARGEKRMRLAELALRAGVTGDDRA